MEQVTKELPNPDPRIVTGQTVLAAVRVHVVSTTGAELRTVTLRPSQRSWDPTGRLSQRSWALSPGGDRLLVVEEAAGAAFLRTFALADGREVREPISVLGLWTPCGVSWVSGAKVSVPVLQPGEPPSRQIVDLGSGEAQTATVVAPRLHAQCVEVLGAALAGPGKGGGLLGTSTAGWTWWWRELTLGLLAAGAVAALLVRWVVRRRRLRQDESTQLDWFG
ncbi:MAG: hypothetical protein ACXV3S_10965 [Kineosporiaceae bacterium]